jgi:uncharacterized protein YegL
MMPVVPTVMPEKGIANEAKQANKCITAKPDCAVLHDLFVSMWANMKDLVDETNQKIHHESSAHAKSERATNLQIQALTVQKEELQGTLAEITSSRAALLEEQKRKEESSREADRLGKETMQECRSTIRGILFTEVCGATKVRNELITSNLDDVSTEDIVDCSVSNWVPSECSVTCDDSLEGGDQVLRRTVITRNDAKWGSACPNLTLTTKCNQVRCPVDCELDEWSTFSKCTTECDGGLQSRTRAVVQDAKNGGRACGSLQESRPCHTESCDRDCRLSDWSEFSHCSKACNSGFITRNKEVLVEARGNGVCPQQLNPVRFQSQSCNTQPCVGDEECLALIDIVIAIDGSGSLTERGFDVLKTFAQKLVLRMKPSAFEREAVRVGVVQFGNGKLNGDWVVSDANVVIPPTDNMEEVVAAIGGLTWQRGFTNMAQAVVKAKSMLDMHGRGHAADVVMLLTDGRPTFVSQTSNAVEQLREEARLVIVQVQAYRQENNVALLKDWVSTPWQTNYIHIPGKKALKGAYESFATTVIAGLCPFAESPSTRMNQETMRGFALEASGRVCEQEPESITTESTPDNCFLYAEQVDPSGWTAFAYAPNAETALGHCLVYTSPCENYQANSTYSVYVRTANEGSAGAEPVSG